MVKKDCFIPIRVTRRQKIVLRQMAREADRDVSSIVREMIEDRMAQLPVAVESGVDDSSEVAA